jgi:hypothetical protein
LIQERERSKRKILSIGRGEHGIAGTFGISNKHRIDSYFVKVVTGCDKFNIFNLIGRFWERKRKSELEKGDGRICVKTH